MTDFLLRRSVQMLKEDPEAAKEAFHEAAKAATPPCPSCKKPIRHRQGLGWCQDHQMREEGPGGLREKVTRRAKTRGWTVAHAGKGWVGDHETGVGQFVTQMKKGWPDLFFLNPNMGPYKFFAAELKAEGNEPDPDQVEMIALLNACGIPTVVFHPSDLRTGRINAILEGRDAY